MARVNLWPAVLGIATAIGLVTIINPLTASLAYASGVVVVLGLLGWVMEAREHAGPPPEVEPEHEEEEEAPGPSYWPIILALGVVGIAAGLIYDTGYGALIVAVPLAGIAAAMWAAEIKEQMPSQEDYLGPPILAPGGRMLLPVPGTQLAAQAAGGAAIAIERAEVKQISRRSVLRFTFWAGLAGFVGAFAASFIDFLYPRGITGFGSVISAGTVDQYPPGTHKDFAEGKFWLVNLTAEQGGPGFLALWWKCPHLGCTVPWRETFSFQDPGTGQTTRGWFRCPCHGSTYNYAGVRVFGPAPRSMDRMEVTIADGRISVNTGAITKGTPDNDKFAVQP